MSSSPRKPLDFSRASDLDEILGLPPLADFDEEQKYAEIRRRVWNTIKPTDFIEVIWVREITRQIWESNRLVVIKAAQMKLAQATGVRLLMNQFSGGHESSGFVAKWLSNDPGTRQEFDRLMQKANLDDADIEATGFAAKIAIFDQLEQWIIRSHNEIAKIYREVERRRDAQTARELRESVAESEDAVVVAEPDDTPNSPVMKSLCDQSVSGATVMTSIAALPSICATMASASASSD